MELMLRKPSGEKLRGDLKLGRLIIKEEWVVV
jgi:hypothetical protein